MTLMYNVTFIFTIAFFFVHTEKYTILIKLLAHDEQLSQVRVIFLAWELWSITKVYD